MSVRLNIADVVQIQVGNGTTRIGKVSYIGYIDSNDYIGINLIQSIQNGGDGSIGRIKYFHAPKGHGIFIRPSNILRKVSAAELMFIMQQNSILFERQRVEYNDAIGQRDERIHELEREQRRRQALLSKKKHTPMPVPSVEPIVTHSYESTDTVYNVSIMSPVPKAKRQVNIRKHSEYSKWHSNSCSESDDWSDIDIGDNMGNFNHSQSLPDEHIVGYSPVPIPRPKPKPPRRQMLKIKKTSKSAPYPLSRCQYGPQPSLQPSLQPHLCLYSVSAQ